MPATRAVTANLQSYDTDTTHFVSGTDDGDYYDKPFLLEMESVRMVRELFVYQQSYAMMQEGVKPEAVLGAILASGSAADKYPGIEGHLANKASCLKQLLTLWRGLSDDKKDDDRIHKAVTLFGTKPKDFMDSLSVKVGNSHWMKGRWWQWKQWARVKVEHAELSPGIDLDNLESVSLETFDRLDTSKQPSLELQAVLKRMVPTPGEARTLRRFEGRGLFSVLMGFFIKTSNKVEYSVYWCGVQGLFEVPGADPTRYMMILANMCSAPPGVFQTIVGQAMVRHHWTLTFYWGFCLDRVIDIFAIFTLFSMAQSTHVQILPLWRDIYGSFFFSLLSLLLTICGYIQCVNMYKTLAPVLTFWNIIFLVVDLSAVAVMSYLMFTNYNVFRGQWQRTDAERTSEFAGSFFDLHAVVFAYLVAGKWFYFLLGMLNLEFIGTAILPVWDAARSKESLVFLAYLFLGTFACAHSYYTFAIDDIPDIFMSFFRMIRLTFLGDFDVMEIMGVDQIVTLSNISALYEAVSLDNVSYADGAIVGGIDDDEQPSYKYGIRAWMVMWAFIGPMMFMNIYIGLLGNAYTKSLGDIEAIFAQFRISTVMSNLLRRHFWLRPLTNMCRFLGLCCIKDTSTNYVEILEQERKSHKFKGYWIAAPASISDVPDDADSISDKLDDFSKQLGLDVDALRHESFTLKERMGDDMETLQGENKAMKDDVAEMKDLLKRALNRRMM